MAWHLIKDNSCPHTTAPTTSIDGNINYERISIQEDDGTIRVIYTGVMWDKNYWESILSNHDKKMHPTIVNANKILDGCNQCIIYTKAKANFCGNCGMSLHY